MRSSVSRLASVWLMNVGRVELLALLERLEQGALDLGVEDHASGRGQDQLAVPAVLDRLLEPDLLRLDRHLDLLLRLEPLRTRLELLDRRLRQVLLAVREVVAAEHHVLAGRGQRAPVGGREDVVRAQHQQPRLRLGLGRERKVDGHLVAVEVRVERVADERMHLDRLALDEDRLEGLDAESMERRRAVQQHRMLGDDLLEHVPDLGRHRVDVLLRRLDVLHALAVDEPAHDERLEELERHDLRQAALVELQVRPGDDHRAARVVDALAEQVLPEAALLALEHVGERLQRPVARAGHRAAAAAVVEQRVDGLLEHPLLVVDDDLGRAEVEQPLEAVVPVDHAPVEVVQVARREPAAVQLHHRAQLGRDHRDRLEDHPLGTVLRLDERVHDLQALDRALLLLALRRLDRLAEEGGLGVEVEVLEQLADRLRAHAAREVDVEPVRRAEAVLQLAEQLLVADDLLRLEVLEELPRVGEPLLRVLGRLARVLAPRLDVEVHLAHLQRPLDDRVEILLLDLPVRAQAEVVRQLADLVGARVRLGRLQHLAEQALAEVARLLDELLVDAGHELLVVLVDLRLLDEQAVEHAVDVLRDRALLRAGRLGEVLVEALERLADLDGRRSRPSPAPSASAAGRRGSRRCGRARGSSSSPRS